MIDPPFNDRWQGESDATGGDRPGIVASLVRYRVILVAAMLVGVVAACDLALQTPVRYQADAVLILSNPGGPSVLGGGDALEIVWFLAWTSGMEQGIITGLAVGLAAYSRGGVRVLQARPPSLVSGGKV